MVQLKIHFIEGELSDLAFEEISAVYVRQIHIEAFGKNQRKEDAGSL